jgi:hypothetical protein
LILGGNSTENKGIIIWGAQLLKKVANGIYKSIFGWRGSSRRLEV